MKSLLPILIALPSLAAAEHPALGSARRSLAEGLPLVALAQLGTAAGFSDAEKPLVTRLLAEAHLRSGEAAEALGVLDSAGEKDPVLRGHIHAALGDWAAALGHYEQAEGVPAQRGAAEALANLGRTPEAVAAFEKLLAEGFTSPALRLRLAGLLADLGRTVDAQILVEGTGAAGSAVIERQRAFSAAKILLTRKEWRPAHDALDALLAQPEGFTPHLFAAATIALAEARREVQGPEAAGLVLETFLFKYPDNPALETAFAALDAIYAAQRSPLERHLHQMAMERGSPSLVRRAALAQFYVTKMQFREGRDFKRVSDSKDFFVKSFPNHPLTTFIHEIHAEAALKSGQLDGAITALEAAQRATTDRERGAILEMRVGLANFEKGDPLLAAGYFQRAAEHSPQLRKNAAFNCALAELAQKNLAGFRERFAEFAAEFPGDPLAGELNLEGGFALARTRDKGAQSALQMFLREFPRHFRRSEAHLVLAELAIENQQPVEAEKHLDAAAASAAGDASGGQKERADFAEIFAAEARQPADNERVAALCAAFLRNHSRSPLVPDVRMKLGQLLFHAQDLLNAQNQFVTLAGEAPDGPYVEKALFLAGQCADGLQNPEAAVGLFNKVVEKKGTLQHHALFQQGLIQHKAGKDASAIFQTILDAQPPAPLELQFAALCARGDNLVSIAEEQSDKLAAALATYTQLGALTDATPAWRNQALYKKGKVLQRLGKESEALVVFSDMLDKPTGELFWYYKAGFDAAAIVEARSQWQQALVIYKKIAATPGPRAAEANAKIKELKLKRFIWD